MRATLAAPFAFVAAATLSAATSLAWRPQQFVPPAYETWIWNDQGGNICADGSQTGFAYSMKANANELLIYFDGGGACWDTETCFTNPTAFNLKGYNNASFQTWTKPALENQILLTSREPARSNPWSNAHFVFIPYCTGDLHAGNAVNTYTGAPAPIYHNGYTNFQNILKVLAGAVPSVSNVWMSGTSAGCFGATLNYIAAKKTWPWSRTHLIGDSCETTPGFLNTKPQWNLRQPAKSDCANCVNGEFNSFLPALSQANTGSRFGSNSYQEDPTLPGFMSVTTQSFSSIISGYFANVTRTTTNQAKTFLVAASGHGMLYDVSPVSVTGVGLASWLATLKNLRAAFKSV